MKKKVEDVTPDGTYFKDGVEMVDPAYVEGLGGRVYQSLPERARYLTLSDGQVLDRAKPPKARALSVLKAKAIRCSNEACYNYHPNKGVISAALLKLVRAT